MITAYKVLFATFFALAAIFGIMQISDCMADHSYLNCSSTAGWGYMTVYD